MTRIDFYFNVSDKALALADLVESAVHKRRHVTICVADESRAAAVSSNMWQQKPESFLPHAAANHATAAFAPIVIHWPEMALQNDELLINLRLEQPSFFSRFTHLIELVGEDEQDKITARARFKFYRDRGYEIKNINYAQKMFL